MKKIVIYPYDISNLYLILQSSIAACIAPKGWGYDQEDAGEKIGVFTGINVDHNFDEAIKCADTLLLAESIFPVPNEDIIEKVDESLRNKKKVIIIRKLDVQLEKELAGKADENLVIYRGNEIDIKTVSALEADNTNTIEDVPVPIILVIGAGERCSKFDVQLELRNTFLKHGFNVSQIGSKQHCELFGFHSFPQFMLDGSSYNENEKIIGFNQYIQKIYRTEKPDVFVIGVPGGVLPYDSEFHNSFGITNILVANAISPDYVIYNSLYVDSLSEYLKELIMQLKNKYNYEIDKIFVGNCAVNLSVTKSDKVLTYTTCKASSIKKKISHLNAYHIFDDQDKKEAMLDILNTLEEYSNLTII